MGTCIHSTDRPPHHDATLSIATRRSLNRPGATARFDRNIRRMAATGASVPRAKVTVPSLLQAKLDKRRIAMITAYDATFASIADEAGVDVLLVGDSVATVMQGERTTLPVSLEEMAYHTRIVAAARPKALIVGDLPFGSYQQGPVMGIESSVRLIKAGAECVKLEGGLSVAHVISAITATDIPVMGHIGLTPQSYHRMGGNKIQGRQQGDQAGQRDRLLQDAHAVEDAGACAVVIEGVPADLAAEITEKLSIPTIGIGAGAACDGQVLVLHDVLGLSRRKLSFAKPFADLLTVSTNAISDYVQEVRDGSWPDAEHSFS